MSRRLGRMKTVLAYLARPLVAGGVLSYWSTPALAEQVSPRTVGAAETRRPLPSERTASELELADDLSKEAELYSRAAEDYERFLGAIIRHHFKERRQRVIERLERDIEVETERVAVARKETVERLSSFIDRYDGVRAHPQATPEAMYRLAALLEEEAREQFDAPLEQSLSRSIALYHRIIAEFPSYSELAGVHYYLGHAYNDSGALEEGQQVWRAMVCSNHFAVVGAPPELQALSQDHDEAFWTQWYDRNPIPLDQLSPQARRDGDDEGERELAYRDPYAECRPIPQQVDEGQEPRYIAEGWWQVGNHHFDQLGAGGPFELNRAASAYEQSSKFKNPPLHAVALYKLAWTHFKHERYADAVRSFVALLLNADEQEEQTGDSGADFRAEAYSYIASSLTYVDFLGPPASDPHIPRSDVLDLETDPLVAEQKMSIAIQRVQDPELVPQERKWTVEVYKAVAEEYIELLQLRNAIAALELTLTRFGLDRDAPKLQAKVAELHDELAALSKEGSRVRQEHSDLALAARTRLSAYVGESPWRVANADDLDALEQAELLVRTGVQRAAADHTNYARSYVARAKELTDPLAQAELRDRAIAEYQRAASGWAAYIEQNPNAADAYESRFWLADARYWSVALQVDAGRSPAAEEVALAAQAARNVRDSNEDDRYLQPAAYYAVALADKVLESRHREYEMSGGARGFPRREAVEFDKRDGEPQVARSAVPPEVERAALARDEYNRRVDYETDPEKNGLLYAFQAADWFFVYGDFERARERFEPIMELNCGNNEWGFKAWEKLVSMSNFEGNAKTSRALVEGKSCAFNEATRAAEVALREPVRQGVAYLEARDLYDAAEALPQGSERDRKWREAAAAYQEALDRAPDRDEAPEAAMNGAYAYKQVGEYDKAIAMYELFISRYGSDAKLRELELGAPEDEPPKEPDPDRYRVRVKFLAMAHEALANAHVLFFNYPKAARAFDTISEVSHLDVEKRRQAAQQALSLYASLGDKAGMHRAHARFMALEPAPDGMAEADFVVASAALKRWDQFSPDAGGNASARAQAEDAMRRFYATKQADPSAQAFVLEAAYWLANMARAQEKDDAEWWQRAIGAFEQYRAVAPRAADGTSTALGSRVAAMAAEGAYRLLDRQIERAFDYQSGHHRFKGTPQQVLAAYAKAADDAKLWFDSLQRIVDEYASPEWGVAAIARQGSLYDSLRSGLFNARPPELIMFDAATEAKLRRAEDSDNLELQEKADAIRVRAETAWRDARDRELVSADSIMVDRYANAIAMARRYNVSNPAVNRAIARLAFFSDVLGEAKLQVYTQRVPALEYRPGMFMRIRPGLLPAPAPDGFPASGFGGGGR